MSYIYRSTTARDQKETTAKLQDAAFITYDHRHDTSRSFSGRFRDLSDAQKELVIRMASGHRPQKIDTIHDVFDPVTGSMTVEPVTLLCTIVERGTSLLHHGSALERLEIMILPDED